jgi:D-amino-acid oxidase
LSKPTDMFSSTVEMPWYSPNMKSFIELESEDIPFGFNYGCKYTSVAIDVPAYLDFLFNSCKKNGALILETTLPTSTSFHGTLIKAKDIIKEKFAGTNRESVSAFVNATGISARVLVPDENVFSIRGQTVVVEGVSERITTAHFPTSNLGPNDPDITYVVPRAVSGQTILGGTKQEGNWESKPNSETTKKIIESARQYTPELLDENGEYKVLGVKVGLRPGRKGGARLEVERLGDILVCHAYGNAGGGKFWCKYIAFNY